MSWARFDDRYDDNRKVKRAWRAHPRAVGLHAMAVTYCARHETDGLVDIEWLEDKIPSRVEREKCLVALLGAGLFERVDDDHFRIHDYLEYNEPAAVLSARRVEERERKRAAGRKGAKARWGKDPDGTAASEGHGSAHGSRMPGAMADAEASMAPDPTRPDPTPNGTTFPNARGEGKQTGQRRTLPDPDELPDDFPAELAPHVDRVVATLTEVAEAKGANAVHRGRVARLLAGRPKAPWLTELPGFADYWLYGAGRERSQRDVVAAWQNWIGKRGDLATIERPGTAKTLVGSGSMVDALNARPLA